MSTNKQAIIRYRVLDSCFRNKGKFYFIEDLISSCEVVLQEQNPNIKRISRRQILYDIQFMESSDGWQIDLERKRIGKKIAYRYTDRNYSINNMPLSDRELFQIRSAIEILNQFQGLPQFEWIEDILSRLSLASEKNFDKIVSFESNEYVKGLEFVSKIYNGIHFKNSLTITYKPFLASASSTFVFHPYYLKQYNSRWYCYGLHEEQNEEDWNLALDRIISVSPSSVQYRPSKSIDWKEYFEDFIGVTKPRDQELSSITLLIQRPTAYYIESRPIHGSQKSKWINNNELLEVRLKLLLNYEFEKILMSYVDTIQIVSPDFLSEKIEKRIEDARILHKS